MIDEKTLLEYNAAGIPKPRGLFDPAHGKDACGVGFIAKMDNVPTHEMVKDAIKILINLEHRGAIGGDAGTGDGAGLLLQMPDEFFRSLESEMGFTLPPLFDYGVGMIFLPTDEKLASKCVDAIEQVVAAEGCKVLGWRNVPNSNGHLGNLARSTQPSIRQIFIDRDTISQEAFERKLYVIRRVIEKTIEAFEEDCSQFYVVSLSARTVVYKGLLTGTQLEVFFKDLLDKKFKVAFSIVHQRYSTNTLPTWKLAQPFRTLAHNGEINTLRGNINRMKAREANIQSDLFGDDAKKLVPIIQEDGSDSAIVDNGLELLIQAGRDLPHALMMMVPEAFGPKIRMSEDKRAFYEYHSALMEPWDGPAALAVTDGIRYIGATLDRNGLRPARYTVTKDGIIIMASESGVLDVAPENILSRGRLQPGKMFLVDLEQHRIVPDNEIKAKISRRKPYRRWVKNNHIELRGLFRPSSAPAFDAAKLLQKQHAFGFTDEDTKMILKPMAVNGQEPIGSMGNDAALAVMSDRPQYVFSYFKQMFAQVTNPPIDPLREELVMSLESFVGREKNFLEESPEHYRGFKLNHPVLTPEDLMLIEGAEHPDINTARIDMLFSAYGGGKALEVALQTLFEKAEKAIDDGASILILSDKNMDKDRASIPVMLAGAGLHHYLIKAGKRTSAAIILETGEVKEVMNYALLVGYGVDAICPYLSFATIRDMYDKKLLEDVVSAEEAMDNYINAIKKGLLKTFSRMGISTLHSFFGSQIFECVGIAQDVIDKYFCGTASRVGGIGLEEMAQEVYMRHQKAFPEKGDPSLMLEAGGVYHIRENGEKHLWSTEAIYKLQMATREDRYDIFKEYSKIFDDNSEARTTLRSLFKFKPQQSIPVDEVEPVEEITKRFCGAAMSFGSISREAHEAIAIAMNRLGGRSNSGEGGEDPARYIPMENGDSKRSKIKQIASGRFGVTTEYAMNADELQIKVAQGAKPGEGGQLPGHKVSVEIAKTRHTTPGVTLISPPPHHDIYSIEDLAQLIYDLKAVNPNARVSVKLVSEVGVGTIASGVAKAKADTVVVAGYDGGTGASPMTAIKHCGLPWELGVAETQQSLIANHLRDRIRLQTDGQLKTGRDLAIATLLGAEEYGFGTTLLITLGCIMMRKCHLNTCPVGVATQEEELRKRFTGQADYVERFLRFIAQEFREYMAMLGFRTVDEMVGRVDCLDMNDAIDHWKQHKLDLSALLVPSADHTKQKLHCFTLQEPSPYERLDDKLIEKAKPALENAEKVIVDLPVRNIHRTAGATLSGLVVQKYGSKGLPDDTIHFNLKGSAGQSFGAFNAPGVTFKVEGDCNDYIGKSMSGGRIILVPPTGATFQPHENVIVGNVSLYGATGGELFINGMAGERFAVRNSGAKAVVEGVGDHGCEYMTGGIVVCIGKTGQNFAAGMSGGIAYVYDDTEMFDTRCNLDMVDLETVWSKEDRKVLHDMITKHYKYTNSERAKFLLDNWEAHLPLFVKVMPIDYRRVLERMKLEAETAKDTVSVTEEVYDG